MWLCVLIACGLGSDPAPPDFEEARARAAQAEAELQEGDREGALAGFEAALAVSASTEDERRERIAYRSGQIDVLLQLGRPLDALESAQRGLEERIALQAADDGFDVADGVVLLGQVQVAAGRPVDLPDAPLRREAVHEAVITRSGRTRADLLVPVLEVLVQRMPDERLHGARAGLAWQSGSFDAAMQSAEWLLANGSPAAKLEAGLLIPRIHEDRGDRRAAEAAYRRTCGVLPDGDALRCQRELGLFLSQDPDETDAARQALRVAARATDPEVRGRSLAALGVLEAHEGSAEVARPLLEDAIAALSIDHPDARFAADHLQTLGTGSCACVDPGGSIEATLQSYADAELPGLVEHVALDPEGAFDLTLTRQPTEAEHAALVALQERVLAEL